MSAGGSVMASVQAQQQQQQQHLAMTSHASQLAPIPNVRVSLNWHQAVREFVFGGTAKFFGVHQLTEEASRAVWNERRRRLAVKRFGGVKDDYHLDGGVYGAQQVQIVFFSKCWPSLGAVHKLCNTIGGRGSTLVLRFGQIVG